MKDLAAYEKMPLEELREQLIDTLTNHFALEHVSMDEFENRVDQINKARNHMAMALIIADLPELPRHNMPNIAPSAQSAALAASGLGGYSLNTGAVSPQDQLFCLFSGQERKGVWKPARRTNALCIFGGADIDLSRAQIPPDGLHISALAIFGGLDIIVPRGVRVQVKGMGVFGGFDNSCDEGENPDAPLVVVEGLAVFGGVDVFHPKKKRKKKE